MDMAAWMQGLGLGRYITAFRDNEIDWEVLPRLTSEDLREIGVVAVGHRRKLLDAIAALGASAPTTAVTAEVSGPSAPADAERRQLTWRRRGQGHRRAGGGLAGAASERRREPVRGITRIGTESAGRSRRRD